MVNKKVFKRKRLLFKKLCSQKLEIVFCSVFMFFSDGYKSNVYSGVYASESIQTFPVVLELKSHPGENVKKWTNAQEVSGLTLRRLWRLQVEVRNSQQRSVRVLSCLLDQFLLCGLHLAFKLRQR